MNDMHDPGQLPRQVGGGILLREAATLADIDVTMRNDSAESYHPVVVDAFQGSLIDDVPGGDLHNFLVCEDRTMGEIASSLCLLHRYSSNCCWASG